MTPITNAEELKAAQERLEELNNLIAAGRQAKWDGQYHYPLTYERSNLVQAIRAYQTPLIAELYDHILAIDYNDDKTGVYFQNPQADYSRHLTRDELLALADELKSIAEGMQPT